MVSTAVRVLFYVLFITAVCVVEYDVPVMMYVKRARFLAEWKVAASMQRQALKSYQAYQKEAEHVRG